MSYTVLEGLLQKILDAALVDPINRINSALWGKTASHMARDLYVCITTVDRAFFALLIGYCALLLWRLYRTALAKRAREIRTLPEQSADRSLLFFLVFTLFSLAGCLSSSIYASFWISPSERRYLLPCYLLPLIGVTMALFHCRGRIPSWCKSILFSSVAIYSAAVILPEGLILRWQDLRLPYPKNARCLDRLAYDTGLRYGYGDYWSAKFLTVHSRAGVRVNQLYPNLALYSWINNFTWYGNAPAGTGRYPEYQFIVMDRMQKNRVLEEFGEPAFQQNCQGSEIYIYNRRQDYKFRNFLRARVSRDLHAPVEPASLAIPKPDGSGWDSASGGIIPATGELVVRFDPPARGDLLEISADNNDEYEVRLYGPDSGADGSLPLGTVRIPKVGARGLRARILPLPDSAQNRPVSSVVIRAVSGDGFYGVGHVFIYKDTWRER
ncbi:MAG: hypothetical protein ACE15F_11955 [bacterium]